MKSKIPKDLGVKIGTPLEALWTNVRNAVKNRIAACEEQLIVEKAFLKMAENKILLEKRK